MFKAGHSYAVKNQGLHSREVLCISVNKRTAAFRTGDSFSIKSLDKSELYEDKGIKSFLGWCYRILG